MKVVNIKDEDLINYGKGISMFIGMPYCSGKCWKELGIDRNHCQNDCLRESKIIDVGIDELVERFEDNPLTDTIVFGGLEPFDSSESLHNFVMSFRYLHNDKIVIYTGYTEEEVKEKFRWVYNYDNIIIKYGRYIPNQEKHYDEVLGVYLASNNQYAKEYHYEN